MGNVYIYIFIFLFIQIHPRYNLSHNGFINYMTSAGKPQPKTIPVKLKNGALDRLLYK